MANGSSTALKSSEEQDAVRRAAKKRQRKNRSGMSLPTSNIFARLDQDKREKREQQQAEAQARRQAAAAQRHKAAEEQRQRIEGQRKQQQKELLEARANQALVAADDPAFKALKFGTIAHRVAADILLHFPTITPMEGKSRIKSAYEKAKQELTPADLSRSNAHYKGFAVARDALDAAFDKIKQQRVQQQGSA